jgi:acetyl-CoA acetyltransferase
MGLPQSAAVPDVFVAGIGMTAFGPQPGESIKSLTRAAVLECLADAGADAGQVEQAYFANALQGIIENQASVPGQIALLDAGISGIPVVNVENACAGGSSAFWLAVNQVRAGAADLVLAVGAEKMVYPQPERRARVAEAFGGGGDVETLPAALEQLRRLGAGLPDDPGEGHRTIFMEIYTAICRAHMARFGTTQRQLATVASKNHAHAVHNERCHYRQAMSADEVLASRRLGYPLTVAMCSPMSDGAAAVLVASEAGLARLARTRPRVRVLACALKSGTVRDWSDFGNHVIRRAADAAYRDAGLGPDAIHLAEVHDAAAFGEIFASELLGLCELGAGGRFAESGATTLGGALPINPSGGLESRGHPISATGLAQVFELTTQLRGEAGARQVNGAVTAIQENGGGFIGTEEAVAVVSILQRA